MKAQWLRDIQSMLATTEFDQWWQLRVEQDQKMHGWRERHDELLAQGNLMEFRAELTQKKAIDTLYVAGELEDGAAQLVAEAAELDNRSYEAVATFENQRLVVSDIYSHMGAVEHNLLSLQSEIQALREQQAAADPERRIELARLQRRKEEAAGEPERRLTELSAQYERENARKMKMWEEVEQMWERALDINLRVAEKRAKSRRARRDAERLFRDAERHKQAAENLSREAEESARNIEQMQAAADEHRRRARELFGCLVGEEFLYWPRRENIKEVYCVPIVEQPEGYNLELFSRSVYLISRQRGVEFIEPVPPSEVLPDADDRRLDDFFGPGRSAGGE